MFRYGDQAQPAGREPASRNFAGISDDLVSFRTRIDSEHRQSLSSLIESEIIPRLMATHSHDKTEASLIERDFVIGPAEVEALVPLVMQVEADALLEHVESILARGVPFDTLMVELLAPTARLLGDLWTDDRCDFTDVTMGLWRLQEVVHEIAGRLPSARSFGAGVRRALFASLPGDQHIFGIVVVDEVFRRGGWMTDRMGEAETPVLLKSVADDWFDIVGLTISGDCLIANLSSLIVALRNVSCNPQLCVLVGGRIFSETPELALQVGADGTASDAKLALKVALQLLRDREWEAAARV